MTSEEKAIRERDASTLYVRDTRSKDVTALLAILDAERRVNAAMLATLRRIADDCDAMSWEEIRALANVAVASAEGR